ncbi:Protein of unknown function [Streptomyces wuyuanensis]|uniref:DUF2470 domain-containing protein n=1 Tax=Streptomyces wuyuanensis TaxID=1196353 RepID=A0A1G9Y3S0_9ACTN|nr:DUF2470 domain-containing protein [Streptomyces wuyuanensis]SDN03095.1 Protein of unknown function [Streptomyces wuyuanensis]
MSRPHGIPLPSAHRSSDAPAPAYDDDEQGQPRPREDARQPTKAERVRTLVENNASVSLTLPGARDHGPGYWEPAARTVTPEGDVVLLVPWDSPTARAAAYAQDDDLTCVMEITDVAPVAVRQRIRGRAWLAGWLTAVRNEDRARFERLLAERHPERSPSLTEADRPAWMLVRLETGEISVDDLWGAGGVEPADLGAAEPDPVGRHEAELLQHLHSAHGDQVRGLAGLLGERGGAAVRGVVPLALDRFGLRLRLTAVEGRTFDARFDFPAPVKDTAELRHAMHTLFAASMG